MITESKVKKFQKINKQSDVMGVVRTLNTEITFSVSKQARKSRKKNVNG